jgi:hypothetical protein
MFHSHVYKTGQSCLLTVCCSVTAATLFGEIWPSTETVVPPVSAGLTIWTQTERR